MNRSEIELTMEVDEECPLCCELLNHDLNFFPCQCGFQICSMCWHRIRNDEDKEPKCPNCRKLYGDEPYQFSPLTPVQEEKLKHLTQTRPNTASKTKTTVSADPLNREKLAQVRVMQKNLVFVVGLSTTLADEKILRKGPYFGKFGKIMKVAVNQATGYAGVQGPSASAYVTYSTTDAALKCIQSINGLFQEGRNLKATLGTTKYCSRFLNGQQCKLTDCMYLHEVADENASFTKEDMGKGKHTEYERKLMDNFRRQQEEKVKQAEQERLLAKAQAERENRLRESEAAAASGAKRKPSTTVTISSVNSHSASTSSPSSSSSASPVTPPVAAVPQTAPVMTAVATAASAVSAAPPPASKRHKNNPPPAGPHQNGVVSKKSKKAAAAVQPAKPNHKRKKSGYDDPDEEEEIVEREEEEVKDSWDTSDEEIDPNHENQKSIKNHENHVTKSKTPTPPPVQPIPVPPVPQPVIQEEIPEPRVPDVTGSHVNNYSIRPDSANPPKSQISSSLPFDPFSSGPSVAGLNRLSPPVAPATRSGPGSGGSTTPHNTTPHNTTPHSTTPILTPTMAAAPPSRSPPGLSGLTGLGNFNPFDSSIIPFPTAKRNGPTTHQPPPSSTTLSHTGLGMFSNPPPNHPPPVNQSVPPLGGLSGLVGPPKIPPNPPTPQFPSSTGSRFSSDPSQPINTRDRQKYPPGFGADKGDDFDFLGMGQNIYEPNPTPPSFLHSRGSQSDRQYYNHRPDFPSQFTNGRTTRTEGLNGSSYQTRPDFGRQRSMPASLSEFNNGVPQLAQNANRDELDFNPCEIAIQGLKSLQLEKDIISGQAQYNLNSHHPHDNARHENRYNDMSNYYQSRGMGLSEPSGNRPGNSFSLGGGLYSNTHSQNPMHNPENSRNNTGESEMKNWQDGLKRLLPNVNIRFSDNLSQNQQTPHLNGYSNRSNQQNDIFRQFQTSNIQRGAPPPGFGGSGNGPPSGYGDSEGYMPDAFLPNGLLD